MFYYFRSNFEDRGIKKKSYSRYRKTKRWQGKRCPIMKRAGYKCQKCKKRPATQVHHKTYKRIGRERLSDLSAVCGGCHNRIDKK